MAIHSITLKQKLNVNSRYERGVFFVEEALKGGYIAKAIGESIFTEAETMDELKINIREAVHCHFDTPSQSNTQHKQLRLLRGQ